MQIDTEETYTVCPLVVAVLGPTAGGTLTTQSSDPPSRPAGSPRF